MKLLFCEQCGDVFQLRIGSERTCECGRVSGRYINRVEAATNGKGVSIAIGNGSLSDSVMKMRGIKDDGRKFYPVMCWVRPNEGPSNPHTKIEK